MKEPAESLLARLGIHRIETPSPFSSIPTNCYFINDERSALIDTGLATQEAYQALSEGLARLNRRVRDIKFIFLTHGHADHRALAERIRAESGAEVFCHPLETARVARIEPQVAMAHRNRELAFFRSMGVPEELLDVLVDGSQEPAFKPRVERVSPINDGDVIDLGAAKLRVLHTPGHCSGSVCFFDEDRRVLFTGDTLLPTSNITAFIEVSRIEGDPRYNPLELHMRSMRRLTELGAAHVLPGHGDIVENYQTVVDALIDRHAKRQRHIIRALRHGPRTLYDMSRSVFMFTPVDDLYFALSELFGNLGLLINDGKVCRSEQDGLVYYAKA
jgi:glyoxylase-like metal-dependent hydrolase (beta-lactamase superfamily II)